MAIFDHAQPKIIKSTFIFSEFDHHEKNNFILSINRRGVQSPTWKNTVPSKEPIPTRNDIT